MCWTWANIDWAATASWAQFVGGLMAVAVAFWVPWRLDIQRRQEEERALLQRRRAAWKTMHALVRLLNDKKLATRSEIEGIASVLNKLDLSIFPEEAVSVLVGLHNRVAMAITAIDRTAQDSREYAKFDFGGDAELHNLSTIQDVMGMGRPVRMYYLGRFLPFVARAPTASPQSSQVK